MEAIGSGADAVRQRAFQVALDGRRSFGSSRRARVVHLEVERGEDELGDLAKRLEAVAVEAGLAPEERDYHPHLTLARARDRGGLPLPGDLPLPPPLPPFQVEAFQLYRSDLHRSGSVYTVIRAFHMLSA